MGLIEKFKEMTDEKADKNKKTVLIVATIVCIVIVLLIVLGVVIPNNKYKNAIALMNEGKLDEAYQIFTELGNYKDASEKANNVFLMKVTRIKEQYENVNIGETITLGKYEQDNDYFNGMEDIEWLVLDVMDGKALVISKYGLDNIQYNTELTNVTWETSTLREWLNNDFINAAFTAEEKAIIPTTMVLSDENPEYGTRPGNETQDQVFLLDINEIFMYFSSPSSRLCKTTDYAVEKGAINFSYDEDFNTVNDSDIGHCYWWLRTPGYRQKNAVYVSDEGGIRIYGFDVNAFGLAVRPAMWIDID